jgi:hypothetical protein
VQANDHGNSSYFYFLQESNDEQNIGRADYKGETHYNEAYNNAADKAADSKGGAYSEA